MSLDYLIDLKKDLVTQFRDQPNIDILVDVIQGQLNEVAAFYKDLRDLRSVYTAQGVQLDGVGKIAVLSRAEAGELASYKESTWVLSDDEYRNYLLFKIWKNTNTCTYHDVQTAFRMFWDKPLYYSEQIEHPATMIFETSILKPEDNALKLFEAPFIKAAGVAIIIIAYTEAEEMEYTLSANSYLGRGYMETYLPDAILINGLMHWMDGTELHISWDEINSYEDEDGPVMESVELFNSAGETDIRISSTLANI